MRKIAIVVQRCGVGVVGGSESLAWQYANLLKDKYEVEILTTTAVDYATWKNDLPPGSDEQDAIIVRRFKVDQERSLYWHELHERLLRLSGKTEGERTQPIKQSGYRGWTLAMEEEFIRQQGPYSVALQEFIEDNYANYGEIIFFTYLYPTTYFGISSLPVYSSFLCPTLHDEPYAYFSVFKNMARRARKVLWLTEAEQRFGERIWGDLSGAVVGMSVTTTMHKPVDLPFPYLLYCGRIDEQKGCGVLVKNFLRFKKTRGSDLRLIFTGEDKIGLPKNRDIVFKGFVSDDKKYQLMAGATLFVMPSKYESFSIVTLEAMAQKTPVLVNAQSEVLADHVKISGGGFIYNDYDDFAEAINTAVTEQGRIIVMGNLAREYVINNYSREMIRKALVEAIENSGADFRSGNLKG
jgi:glycosyltransferase involved in cell wall biosynthesis